MSIDDLPSRVEGLTTELQCPVCRTWRAAFLITETPAERADEVGGAAFVCDVERSRWNREAAAAAERAAAETLPAVKAAQRAIINAARDSAQDGGADTPLGRFDTRPRSREFLNGAVTTAILATQTNAAFVLEWTLADDTDIALDAEDTITAGVAVAQWVSAVHDRARVLKNRIDAAETVEAVRAVVWTLADE